MHLKQIIEEARPNHTKSAPDWMIGAFKRRSIAFANGLTDTDTFVFWLQSKNLTIDLRLPIEADRVDSNLIHALSEKQLRTLSNYEGWYAESKWENERLSWSGGTCFQLHNRWPEPAELQRVGDCMIEFAPSGAYVEDWRLLSRNVGPLVGLRLIDEVDVASGETRHKDGALIINGNWAGMVLGRPIEPTSDSAQLRDLVASGTYSTDQLNQLFQFETSIASGSLEEGFQVQHSTIESRVNQALCSLEDFSWYENRNSHSLGMEIHHKFEENGRVIKRRFTVDALEAEYSYSSITPQTELASNWFEREGETLGRYLKIAPS